MKVYSPYFHTLHDEQGPVGRLGRGTHYSILRAVVFHDENGRPTAGTDFNFAVVWDEDHDERVIFAVEECYRRRILSSFIAFGERKGGFYAILAPAALNWRFPIVSNQLDLIAENGVETDTWCAEIGTIDRPGGIISESDENITLYLKTLKMLWNLGPLRRDRFSCFSRGDQTRWPFECVCREAGDHPGKNPSCRSGFNAR